MTSVIGIQYGTALHCREINCLYFAVTSLAQSRTAKQAFQRVRSDEWLGKKGSWNNSYEAANGSAGYGAKAQEVLGQVEHITYR